MDGITFRREVVEVEPKDGFRCYKPGMEHLEIPVPEVIYAYLDRALQERRPVSLHFCSVESGRTVVLIENADSAA